MPNGVHFTEADYYRAATEAQHARQRLNGCRDDLDRAHQLLMETLRYLPRDEAADLIRAIMVAVR